MSCPLESQHQGKELLNLMVSLPIDAVFTLLFVQEQFMVDVYQAKKTTEVTATSWQEQDDGVKTRQMTYTMTLPPNNISPKYSYVTENQTLLPQSNPGSIYLVEAEVINAGIPYADSFVVVKHYCIIKQEDKRTSVVSWVSIKYKKNVWGFVKSMIEKNTYTGVEGVFQELAIQLTAEAEKVNPTAVGRKRRRATNANVTARSHSPGNNLHHKKSSHKEGPNRTWIVVLISLSLFVLLAANVFIYNKLFYLEELSGLRNSGMLIPPVRYLGVSGSWEEVARILQKQQSLHDDQLEVWKTKIEKASTNLQEVQETLEWMILNIKEHEENLRKFLEEQSETVRTQWTEEEEIVENKLVHLLSDHEKEPLVVLAE